MDRKLLRLELLKLVYKAMPMGRVEQAEADARQLETFCLEFEAPEPKAVLEEPPVKEPAKPPQQFHKKGNGR